MRLLADIDRLAIALAAIKTDPVDPELAMLVLALEDRRFWRHRGVDLLAGVRATGRWLLGRAKGGASTIDMQLVRTVTGRRERTLCRKGLEALLALAIRRRFGSGQVLSIYATAAYCGEEVTGLRAAALRLHGRTPSELTICEKAIVAATLLHPIPTVPTKSWRARIDRRARYAVGTVGRVRHARTQPLARFSDDAP